MTSERDRPENRRLCGKLFLPLISAPFECCIGNVCNNDNEAALDWLLLLFWSMLSSIVTCLLCSVFLQ